MANRVRSQLYESCMYQGTDATSRGELPRLALVVSAWLITIWSYSCVALAWIFNIAVFMSCLVTTVFTLMRTYALLAMPLDADSSSRRNIALGVVMLVLCTTIIIDNGIGILWRMPANLPPPYNCSATTSMSSSLIATIYSRNGVHNYGALGGRRCHPAKNLVVMATTIGDRDSKPSTDLAQRDVSIR
ncbi:hypothetical protein C8Q77DRAFT_488990 [Trametes polyzona]|nr:hypothetical protein C8Q77DRAFT_488990 [Trametes polyzona]